MEPNGVSAFRHRQSPSSERFLGIFSSSQPENVNGEIAVTSAGDELDEDDVFWTGDFSESNRKSNPITITSNRSHRSSSFRRPETFGILAALPEDEKKRFTGDRSVLYRKPSFSSSSSSPLSPSPMAASSSSRMVLAIPKPPQTPQERDSSLSGPAGKFHQSAPVNVPVLSKAMAAVKAKNRTIFEVDDHDGDDEMLPPHEIVARGSRRSPMTTTSVLEGAGRTLKGRDLRQVRNAVWRQTGFLD